MDVSRIKEKVLWAREGVVNYTSIRQAWGCGVRNSIASLGLLLFCVGAGAESLSPSPMPLEATVSPSTTVPGGVVQFSGTATTLGNDRVVTITVTPPWGGDVTLTSTVDADRHYSADFRVPVDKTGRFTVLIKGPGGQGLGRLEFDVVAFSSQRGQIKRKLGTVISKTSAVIDNIYNIVERSPVSPTQQDARESVTRLREMIVQSEAQVAGVDEALAILDELVEQLPPLAEHLAPVYNGLHDGLSQAEHLLSATPSGSESNLCDGLYYTGQGLKTASLAFTMASGAVATAYSILQGMSVDALVSAIPPTYRITGVRGIITLAVNRTVERIREPSAYLARMAGTITDMVPMFVDGFFELYCEKFSGKVKGQLTVEVREKGVAWWTYTVEIDAVINVRYERTGGDGTTSVTGEIEGVGSKFKTWEDFTVLDPRVRKDVLVRFMIPPLPGSLRAVSTTGLAGVFTPAYFRVPLRGEVTRNKLKLELLPATQDFRDSKKTTVAYVLLSHRMPVPYALTTKLPFQSAHFMLTRSLGGAPEFDIAVDRAAKIMRVKKIATRSADMDSGNITLKFNTRLEACNPECP